MYNIPALSDMDISELREVAGFMNIPVARKLPKEELVCAVLHQQ